MIVATSVCLWFSQTYDLGRLHELGERIRKNTISVTCGVLVSQSRVSPPPNELDRMSVDSLRDHGEITHQNGQA